MIIEAMHEKCELPARLCLQTPLFHCHALLVVLINVSDEGSIQACDWWIFYQEAEVTNIVGVHVYDAHENFMYDQKIT